MDNNDNLKPFRKHIVLCPHCQSENLDHMTQCRKCGGRLEPRGYTPMFSPEVSKRIKTVLTISLSVVAIVVVVLYLIGKK